MHEALINNWNSVVGPNDIVYHLGDFFISTNTEDIDIVLSRLNGTIRLVKGNHDKWVTKIPKLIYGYKIEWVKDYFEHKFTVNGENILVVMMHYPMRAWNKSHYGSIQFHGHSHGALDKENLKYMRRDVGVDSSSYFPQEISKLIGSLQAERRSGKVKFINHHDSE